MVHLRRGIALTVLLAGAGVAPVTAISNGAPDGERHPSTGFVALLREGRPPFPVCTGVLVAEDLFLTSAHCIAGQVEEFEAGVLDVAVGFDSDFSGRPTENLIPASSLHPHPGFDLVIEAESSDVAVIILDLAAKPPHVVMPAPARLPERGLLHELHRRGGFRDRRVTIVGYGIEVHFEQGRPFFRDPLLRQTVTAQLQALAPGYVHFLEIPQLGNGGICFGDSGGPLFLGDTDIVVGLVGLTDAMCRAFGAGYRLDTEAARDFLGDFLPLP